MTRYIIIGAGAIGGAIGGQLTRAGKTAVLVARGAHLEALRNHGLRLRTPDLDETVAVQTAGGPDDVRLTRDDVLVVATKTQQAESALVVWADVPVYDGSDTIGTAGATLPVLMALNGVASEQIALRYFSRVFGICVWMPAVHLEPGEVIIRSTPRSGMLHLGRVPGPALPEDQELLAQIAADWDAAGFDVPLPDDVMPWKYRKLLSNLGNVFQALVGQNGSTRVMVAAADTEAREILTAADIEVTPDEDEAEARAARAVGFTMNEVPGVPSYLGGSTWQSLTRGTGNVETDYLNGEIAQIAHRIGRTAPINAHVASLARIAAATGQQPGAISAAELAAILGIPTG